MALNVAERDHEIGIRRVPRIEERLAEQPDDEFRAQQAGYRRRYVRYQRELLGWAISVGRKP